ncbi:hypothetical protein ACLB2K_029657 [Fragaria x ananassa]
MMITFSSALVIMLDARNSWIVLPSILLASVPPEVRESLNISGFTARKLFTQNHKELMNAAETSMKGTATSCTVVGALIVTMMFAAAFTVPGGNDSTGLLIFIDKKLFKVFIVSDAVSLLFHKFSNYLFGTPHFRICRR